MAANPKSQAYVAELVGTFALVFFGSLSVTVFAEVVGDGVDAGALVGIALAHGLVLAAMVYGLGHVSGCHINPAVTVAMVATKRMTPGDGASYLIAQLAGAAIAGLAHRAVLPDAGELTNFGATLPGAAIEGSTVTALVVEALLTFFLVWSIFATAVSGRAPAGWHGFAIGTTLLVAVLVGGPLTGAALNPARAFGPALAAGVWTAHWAYWVGPILGGLAAAFAYTYLFLRPAGPETATAQNSVEA